MTEAEFRAAVLDVFPRHHGIRVWHACNDAGWRTHVIKCGESFIIAWHGTIRSPLKWRVHAGRTVGKGASLQDAVNAAMGALADAAKQLDKQMVAMASAQQPL